MTYVARHQNRYKYRDNGVDRNLVRTMKSFYWACISFIDYQVGRVMQCLEETGRLENTLILFSSDHGEMLGDYDCFGKRTMLDSAPLPAGLYQDQNWDGRNGRGEVVVNGVYLAEILVTFGDGTAQRHIRKVAVVR